MQHNVKFLEAVHAFADGGKAKDLIRAMEESQPSQEEMLWVMNMYRTAAGNPPLTQMNGNFAEVLAAQLDTIATLPHEEFSITLDYCDNLHKADAGMYKKMPSELGMGSREGPVEEPGNFGEARGVKRPGTILYETLSSQGWVPISTTFFGADKRHIPTKRQYQEFLALVQQRGMEHDVCSFKRGSLNFAMVSPVLHQLCREHFKHEKRLPLQPGERVKSVFEHPILPLLKAIGEKMTHLKIPMELALVHRQSRTNKALCLTPLLQEILSDRGIIHIRQGNPNCAVGVDSTLIPDKERSLNALARQICLEVKKRSKKRVSPSADNELQGPERFIKTFDDNERGLR